MENAKKMRIVMAMLILAMSAIQTAAEETDVRGNDDLQFICSPALESLANELAVKYSGEFGGAKIEVTTVHDHQISGDFGEGIVALVTNESLGDLDGENFFKLVLGRDAIVPVMNLSHPQIGLIREHGISAQQFAQIYSAGQSITWGKVLGTPDQDPVHAYRTGGAEANNYLAGFLNLASGEIKGSEVTETEDLLRKIGNDPGAIGFCSLASLMTLEGYGPEAGIGLVPIDSDGDGRISPFEDVYRSLSTLSHAIYVGKYPRTLYSRIYAVTAVQPATEEKQALLEWMVNEGQAAFATSGLLELDYGEKASVMEKLTRYAQAATVTTAHASQSMIILLMAGILLLGGFMVFLFAWIGARRGEVDREAVEEAGVPSEFPGGLFFDRSHTWAFMERSGHVRIGIDNFLQNVTGPVTRVVMIQPGNEIKKGDPFLTMIQNGKRLDIKSPVSGIVEKQNSELLTDASLLNDDPYVEGWVLLVRPLNWISELKSYFMGDPYTNWLKAESTRLKDFLGSVLCIQGNPETVPVMQDGGEINKGVLESLGPDVWEEFQTGFINGTK